jgi:Zn-dependent protease
MFPSRVEIAIYMLVGLIIGVIFHEFMHGYVAYRMGDTTAKRAGRLTLDPLAHVDPFGTLILPGFLFLLSLLGHGTFIIGYAKPVPINPFQFRKPRAIIWVAMAGPLSNLLIAIVFFGLARVFLQFSLSTLIYRVIYTCIFIGFINVLLFVFNLIPIPPLDGSRVVAYFLKGEAKRAYLSIEPYGFLIVFLLVIVFGVAFTTVVGEAANIILRIFGVPFRF